MGWGLNLEHVGHWGAFLTRTTVVCKPTMTMEEAYRGPAYPAHIRTTWRKMSSENLDGPKIGKWIMVAGVTCIRLEHVV